MKEPILVKLKMKKIYKSSLSFLGFLIVGVVFIGILYLFYDKVLNEGEIYANGVLSINYVNGKKINTNDSKTIKFSVTNESDNVTYYYVSFNDLKGSGNYVLKYNNSIIGEGNLNASNENISDYISLDAKETKDYTLTINTNDTIKGSIAVESPNKTVFTFADSILKNTPPVNNTLTKIGDEIASDNEGLIKSTDDLGISYYYRGKIENNYVEFADMLWRIVRINGDRTVRLVLNDVLEDVGSYYTLENKLYNFKDSNMAIYLNDWFNNNLKDQEKYLANTKYCNDIVKDSSNNFIAYTRIMTNKIPTLNCVGELFSSNIGLLSIDEIILAGAAPLYNNTSFYLYNSNIKDPWYTMTGAKGNNESLNMFLISASGGLVTNIEGNLYRKVRPVINLIKDIEVSGDGTITNPYKIVEQ